MNKPNIRPTRENWREFCEEPPLTDAEYAEWLRLSDAVKADVELYARLLVEVPGNRRPTVFGDDWADVVAETDAKRRMVRAELAWWRAHEQA